VAAGPSSVHPKETGAGAVRTSPRPIFSAGAIITCWALRGYHGDVTRFDHQGAPAGASVPGLLIFRVFPSGFASDRESGGRGWLNSTPPFEVVASSPARGAGCHWKATPGASLRGRDDRSVLSPLFCLISADAGHGQTILLQAHRIQRLSSVSGQNGVHFNAANPGDLALRAQSVTEFSLQRAPIGRNIVLKRSGILLIRLQRYYDSLRHPSAPSLSLKGVRLINNPSRTGGSVVQR
jgi:hypothetical protein